MIAWPTTPPATELEILAMISGLYAFDTRDELRLAALVALLTEAQERRQDEATHG